MTSKTYDEAKYGYRVEIVVTSTKDRCSIIGSLYDRNGTLLPATVLVESDGKCTRERLLSGVKSLRARIKERRLYNGRIGEALTRLERKV